MRLCTPAEFKTVSFAVAYQPDTLEPAKSIRYLSELAAKQYMVSPNDLKKSKRIFIDPRSMVCYLAYYELKMTLKEIAYYFNKDHSTIIYNREHCEELLQTDKEFLKKFLFVKSKMV